MIGDETVAHLPLMGHARIVAGRDDAVPDLHMGDGGRREKTRKCDRHAIRVRKGS
jgi:hypothetical protein